MAHHSDGRVVTQYLGFLIAGEVYGAELLRVREIVSCGALTRLPGVPPCVRGVVNLRGRALPVIDLAMRFGLPELTVSHRTCVVVFDVGATEPGQPASARGVLVDAVTQLLELSEDDIEPPPAFGTQAGPEFVRGMGKLNGAFALLLDIDRALDLRGVTAAVGALEAESAGLLADGEVTTAGDESVVIEEEAEPVSVEDELVLAEAATAGR